MKRKRKKSGYGTVYTDVMMIPSLSMGAKAVYGYIASLTGSKDFCFPSYQTIADSVGCSRRHAINLIKELVAHKVLEKETKHMRANRYYLLDENDFGMCPNDSEQDAPSELSAPSGEQDALASELYAPASEQHAPNHLTGTRTGTLNENSGNKNLTTSFNPQKKENDSSAPRPRADALPKAVTENRQNATKTFDYTELPYFNTKLIVWQNQNNKKGDPIEKYVKAFKKWERETDTSQLNDSRHVINTFFLNVGKYLEKKPVAAVFRKPSF